MKLNIYREQLLPALQNIVNVIEKRQTMPILSNVLMKIDKTTLTLTGSDLEVQMVIQIQIDKTEFDQITVPARKFLDICRLLPSEASIDLELQQEKLKIISERSRFILSTLDAENYPAFSESKLDQKFLIASSQLKKALNKTLFCMANQDVRYYLNGLMLNISNQKIKLVASDGHRLSIYESNLDSASGIEAVIIIPRKGIMELGRLLEDSDDMLEIQFSKSNIKVIMDKLQFSAKLIDAKYPDFNKVFHQGFLKPLPLPRQALKDALTRVAILSNEKYKGISLNISPGLLKISTHNPEHEEAEEEIAIDYNGDPISIAFNAQYLLDAVSNLDSDTALMTIAENISSCLIEDPADQSYKFIVMPMKL